MSFENQIQQWVQVDNQMKTLNEKLKELRDIKNKRDVKYLPEIKRFYTN